MYVSTGIHELGMEHAGMPSGDDTHAWRSGVINSPPATGNVFTDMKNCDVRCGGADFEVLTWLLRCCNTSY